MHELTKTYIAGAGETDCFGRLKPSSVFYILQNLATLHAEMLNLERESLIGGNGALWLLARQRFTLRRPIKAREELQVTTWHRKTAGSVWYRDYELAADGETVGEATGVWITADVKTKKMVDLSLLGKRSEHPLKKDGPEVKKIRMPDVLIESGVHKVGYSDIDVNAHLNNVKTSEIILNAYPLQDMPHGKYINEFQVSFLKESRPLDELILYTVKSGNTVYTEGRCRGERRFESFFVFDGGLAD